MRTVLIDLTGSVLLRYDELDAQAAMLEAALRSRGLMPGDVVAASLANGPGFVVVLHACLLGRYVFVPLSPYLRERERDRILALAQPVVMFSGRPVPDWPTARWVVRAAPDARCDDWDWSRRRATAEVEFRNGPSPTSSDALLLFTSGTTGRPKGVLLSQENVDAGTRAVIETYQLTQHDGIVAALPWTHGHGLIGTLLSTVRSGGTVITVDPNSLVASFSALSKVHPTWFSAVPPLIAMVCDCQEAARLPLGLRFVRSASAPLPLSLATRVEALFQCPISNAYGMTETAHQAAANPPNWRQRHLDTVGVPTGTEIRLSDESSGGGRGIEVRGPSLFRGYVGDQDQTAAALTADGWYRTGDIGLITTGGHIRLVGRRSELINRGGYKISPAEVEEALLSHPAVQESLVTAVSHDALGEEVAALVVVRPGLELTLPDVRRHAMNALEPHKLPSIIRIVESVPHLSSGKPNRALARRMLESERSLK